jgi:hypothetical protein
MSVLVVSSTRAPDLIGIERQSFCFSRCQKSSDKNPNDEDGKSDEGFLHTISISLPAYVDSVL